MMSEEEVEFNFGDVNIFSNSNNEGDHARHPHEDLRQRLSLSVGLSPSIDSSPYETTRRRCPSILTKQTRERDEIPSDIDDENQNDILSNDDDDSDGSFSTSATASVFTITTCESLQTVTASSLAGSTSDLERPAVRRRVRFSFSSSINNNNDDNDGVTASPDCSPEELSIVYIPTINRKDYTFEERSDAWYSLKELLLLKSDADRTWDDIRHNRIPMERGFEHRKKVDDGSFVMKTQKRKRSIVRKAMLREQKKRKAVAVADKNVGDGTEIAAVDAATADVDAIAEALAKVCEPYTYQSQTLAAVKALLDRKVANGILFDDEDSSSVLAMKYCQRHDEHGTAANADSSASLPIPPSAISNNGNNSDSDNTHSPRRRKAILELLNTCRHLPGMAEENDSR